MSFRSIIRSALAATLILLGAIPTLAQDKPADAEAVAIYADAANFQTNGALDLAIEQWKTFLKNFPQHKLAPQAAHYLGVCQMQTNPPDWIEAIKSFGIALQTSDYDLREESLFNRAFCLYAAGTANDVVDKGWLQESLETFGKLLKANPDSPYRDRAYFYAGECAYQIGKPEQAIQLYTKLITLDDAAESSLRCDALYARGVAQEDVQLNEAAIKSFEQLLKSCAENDLIVDVRLRIGDLQIAESLFSPAVETFAQIIADSSGLATDDEAAYAMFRQAYAYVRLKKPDDAAERYEGLIQAYPESAYTLAATLAAAQTRYQAGALEAAGRWFERVLAGDDPVAATEAAHWLSRIKLSAASDAVEGSVEQKTAAQSALDIATRQIMKGAQGDYQLNLELDAAEALSMMKDRLDEALTKFESFANQAPTSPLAPQALYNAAFTALSIGDHARALKLANEFSQRYASTPLTPDVQSIVAESLFVSGKAAAAAEQYKVLVDNPKYQDNAQRPTWILRAATTMIAADQFDPAASLINKNMDALASPPLKAEAYWIIGQAQLKTGQSAGAAESFRSARFADPDWSRAEESMLLEANAEEAAGNLDAANEAWKQIVLLTPETKIADQARYKLAQVASDAGRYDDAIALFDPIISSQRDDNLLPFAVYGRGRAQMLAQRYDIAADTLGRVIADFPKHPILDDALLARGISLRNLKQYAPAKQDLLDFLSMKPTDINLGHGLYELSLVQQKSGETAAAAESLMKLTQAVPNYPGMDKVMYELGWSLQMSGNDAGALEQFMSLISRFPGFESIDEAAYFVGQHEYRNEQWPSAVTAFAMAAEKTKQPDLLEKSLYRLGWSQYKLGQYADAEATFTRQFRESPNGELYLDAMMMVGESRFKQEQFDPALRAYRRAREKIEADGDTAKTIRDPAERQVRELTLLHGGQSAAQLKDWATAIDWYDELRERFPATTYLAQVFYETAFAHQQAGNDDLAIPLYTQVADNYRNEIGARARFMLGEIRFAQKSFTPAIEDFQRVMFGYGAEKATVDIQNWQAKSGFEAGRCAELMADSAPTDAGRTKAIGFARRFYDYVVQKHATHDLAAKAEERLRSLDNNR